MLKKNMVYTTRQIKTKFGGSIVPSMPFVNGTVPYCKFNPQINKQFPKEAWIEVGPLRLKGAIYLIQSSKKIPVFEKVSGGKWIYLGKASVTDGTTSKRLNQINQNPPRGIVQKILILTF